MDLLWLPKFIKSENKIKLRKIKQKSILDPGLVVGSQLVAEKVSVVRLQVHFHREMITDLKSLNYHKKKPKKDIK